MDLEARVAAIEAKLGIINRPLEDGDVVLFKKIIDGQEVYIVKNDEGLGMETFLRNNDDKDDSDLVVMFVNFIDKLVRDGVI